MDNWSQFLINSPALYCSQQFLLPALDRRDAGVSCATKTVMLSRAYTMPRPVLGPGGRAEAAWSRPAPRRCLGWIFLCKVPHKQDFCFVLFCFTEVLSFLISGSSSSTWGQILCLLTIKLFHFSGRRNFKDLPVYSVCFTDKESGAQRRVTSDWAFIVHVIYHKE